MKYLAIFFCALLSAFSYSQSFLIEAESFDKKGGWVVDPQFVEQMGSPYLLAHGLGEPVENASTKITFPTKGTYHVWVRINNLVPGTWDAPARVRDTVYGFCLDNEFAT